MGHITFGPGALPGSLSEIVGYKSGIALNLEELAGHAGKHASTVRRSLDLPVRLHSMEYEELVTQVLYRLGRLRSPSTVPATLELQLKYRDDPEASLALQGLIENLVACVSSQSRQPGAKGPIDLTPVLKFAMTRKDRHSAALALELVETLRERAEASPFSEFRSVIWRDELELRSLFESESLTVQHGAYLDQRFIDYLAQNSGALDMMNWRKFEGLAAEFFHREGYRVEIGPGRNDDGIDLRAWKDPELGAIAPTLLVQCKRERRKIGKVVVKALWADVLAEKAKSGLIVTTSGLSPGATKVCQARGYAVRQADRETVTKWLEAMRSPRSGVFFGM